METTKHTIRIINHNHIKEDNHTKEEWDLIINDLKRCIVNIPEWVYYHFLECVPPIYPSNKIGFFNSEPLDHDKYGKAIYYYFFKHNNKCYGTISTIETQEFIFQLAKESLKIEQNI